MEATINKKVQIGEAWTTYGKCDCLQASRLRIFGDYIWCWGKVTKIKPFRQKNSQMEQKRKYDSAGMLHKKHNNTSNRLHKKSTNMD